MESSFFEYRDKTGVGMESDSDTEIIDSSLVVEDSFVSKKKLAGKNQTVFVAESDSYTEDESDDDEVENGTETNKPKSVLRRSSVHNAHVISSGDEDGSRRGSIRRPSESSSNKVVMSSSDEGEGDVSPELVPRRRPPMQDKSNSSIDTSIIGRCRRNKRMILQDSDTENSIIIEHDKHKKLLCLKDTPLKVDEINKADIRKASLNDSQLDRGDESRSDDEMCYSDGGNTESYNETCHSDDESNVSLNKKHHSDEKSYKETSKSNEYGKIAKDIKGKNNIDEEESEDEKEARFNEMHHGDVKRRNKKGHSFDKKDKSCKETHKSVDYGGDDSDVEDRESDDDSGESNVDGEQSEDDGLDEEQMLMSRATRMSIMGVISKGNYADDSDESDLIQSDEKSRSSSRNSLPDSLPDCGLSIHHTPVKEAPEDTSHLSCSPFTSPLHDVTNALNQLERSKDGVDKSGSGKMRQRSGANRIPDANRCNDDEVTIVDDIVDLKSKVLHNIAKGNKENANEDDDVTIIDTEPEIIALSSDEEEKSPTKKKSPKASKEKAPIVPKQESTSQRSRKDLLQQYLAPPSYPNQNVAYVKKYVRENELAKLEKLRADLYNVKHLLEQMDSTTLPDGGKKLIERYYSLEKEVRSQGDKVANMVVEPDQPMKVDVARDGFSNKDADKGLSWDEIQKQSNAVQPRTFGTQAMASHMAERNLILERLRDLHKSLDSRPPESREAPAPRALATRLMPHQRHALAWLQWRETQSPPGGILADDMGLGKTVTMIALVLTDKEGKISHDEEEDDVGRGSARLVQGGTLVVCPASLMQQWAAEVRKHCGAGAAHALSVCLHHGARRASLPHRLATYDLVLTTYQLMQKDKEKNGVLMKIMWRRVILDEAHIVRNHKSLTCGGAVALRARRRWALTGTPVQNKDLDLFALLKFLRCTPFDDLAMWKKWIDNKSMGGQERLSTIMRCLLLRRTKQQLQQRGQLDCLPDHTHHLVEVTLAKEEMNVYQKVLVFSKTLFAQFLHQRAEAAAPVLGAPAHDSAYAAMHKKMIALQGAKPVKSHQILVLLLRLRQVCCHCGLIAVMLDAVEDTEVVEDPAGQDLLAELNKLSLEDERSKLKNGQIEDKEEDEREEEGTTVTEAIRSVLSPNNPVFELSRPSSKIAAVMKCLRENVFVNKGEKAVVVSQWTEVLNLVEQNLRKEMVQFVTLSGKVPVPARPPLINKLNDPQSDVRVMLLSLSAGGVGLNLMGANHLLLLDPHWNPQLEQQAQDRVYRVGQTRPVHVYRFMCVDTVEQSIRKLQQAKLELAENVLTGAKHTTGTKLTIEELKVLFNMGQ